MGRRGTGERRREKRESVKRTKGRGEEEGSPGH